MVNAPNAPIDFERHPLGEPQDETDISLRAYFARLGDDHLRRYDPSWSDDEVQAWDGNFRADGALMLVCCERDVEIDEYRRVLDEHLRLRFPDSAEEQAKCSLSDS